MENNESKDTMLTTFDNPFNPFDEFEIWWKMDLILGHNCCGLLAMKAHTSEIFSDAVNEQEIDRAMEEICRSEPMIYRIVTRDDYAITPQSA